MRCGQLNANCKNSQASHHSLYSSQCRASSSHVEASRSKCCLKKLSPKLHVIAHRRHPSPLHPKSKLVHNTGQLWCFQTQHKIVSLGAYKGFSCSNSKIHYCLKINKIFDHRTEISISRWLSTSDPTYINFKQAINHRINRIKTTRITPIISYTNT